MKKTSLVNATRRTALAVLLTLTLAALAFPQKTTDLAKVFSEAAERKGKLPVIIIPGILGSELVNSKTGEKVWFTIGRSKDDDVRLPIGTDLKALRDDLEPGDIIRKLDIPILKDVEVYQQLIDSLERFGGYTEGKWDGSEKELTDKYFLFPYDWRRDNVETARLLFRRIESLKRASGNRDIKFNIIAHSMGGLVARYAAMYGDSDIPAGTPRPNWSGEAHFSKIFLFGTPNEGSADALQVLLEGFGAIRNINLPFVRDVTPFDVLTMPAAFQLLPHEGTFRVYDENLQPLEADIFDPATWKKYGWSIYGDDKLSDKFSELEIGRMEAYLDVVLDRAKRFHEALAARTDGRGNVGFFIIGSDCIDTLDGVVIYRDPRKDKWVTMSKADSFRKEDGTKVESKDVEAVLIKPGDGRVSRRSLLAETLDRSRRQSVLFDSALPLTYALFVCEVHDKLTGNRTIQNNILTALVSEASQ